MATPIPAALKTADIQRFATRAAQLSTHRPIVSYWLSYYILQQLLSKNLHSVDAECQNYAADLMDKLEATKSAQPTNDAITDDVAAKAYVENFALETFGRAEAVQREGKVTRQTAETFQAAATFLDSMAIWGPLDEEVRAKSKFAKFHALRIAKAIKAGEDPNASNPVVEEVQQPPPLADGEEGIEAELKALEYQHPTVESAADSGAASPRDHPIQVELHPPVESSASNGGEDHDVSPIEPANRQGSIGGGYFPSVPSDDRTSGIDIEMGDAPLPPPEDTAASDFYHTATSAPTPGIDLPPPDLPHTAPAPPSRQAPPPAHNYKNSQYKAPPPRAVAAPPPRAVAPPPAPKASYATNAPTGGSGSAYNRDDESTMVAQKHAKWAISALNFEDIDTAVKELRLALEILGA